MANRPRGYGMTAELARKRDAKYSPELAQEAIEWLNAVLRDGGKQDAEVSVDYSDQKSIQDGLKNGVALCEAINVLRAGSIKKINGGKMAFKLMENIGNFLTAAEAYGCVKTDMFQTVDLYEGANIPQVINGIFALGRKAQKNGYSGATLGPKEANANAREFTEEQLSAGQNVIGLQMGTNKGASQAGMAFGKTRHIID